MRAKPPSVPSALARREAVRNRLAGAVDSRDAQAVLSFTGQWVHRQGMASLPPLMAELAQGETLLWWQQLLHQPSEPVGLAPGPAAQAAPAPEPPAPAPTLQAHQEPVPSSLASVTAAEMDPDPEGSQTAEIPALASKPGESKPGELQPDEFNPKELKPVADSQAPLPAMAPAPAPAPAHAPAPTTAKPPVPMAMTPVPMPMAVAPAPRQPAAQVRRGAGTSRPAPAPRNPELARLRAWLPDHDSLGGSSRRSHAA